MIDELNRFLLVAKEGNLTRSAKRLFITQSALTQSMHRLEKNLNTKLFQQKGKQLQLTEDGKSIVIIGEKILKLWTNAHDATLRSALYPTYTVGLYDNVALRLGSFFQSNLQTDSYKLEMIIDSSGKLLAQLQMGTLDSALCVLNKNYYLPNHLTLLQTFSEELLPVSSKMFTDTITNVPFILYNRGSHTRKQIDETFSHSGIQPILYAESTSVTFMKELALLGCGVTLLPRNFVKQDVEQGRLLIQNMPIHWQREYGLYTQKQFTEQTTFIKDLLSALVKSTTLASLQ